MIFPISHEQMSARRWPIVTTALFVLCVIVQSILTVVGYHGGQDDRTADAVEYFAEHPYLDVKPDALPELDEATVKGAHIAAQGFTAPSDDERAAEQAELDARIAAASRVRQDDPYRRFGYVPAAPALVGLVTYTFVHAGWMHLAGNMWFLFLCGMTLEDRWGRVVFPLFYVAAGAAAALVFGLFTTHSTVPLVGASGAIAGCMGAFCVAFAKTRVRFALWIGFRPTLLTAPAYAILPIWAAWEALWGWLLPGSGTAHMAHVGGFVFGVVAGLALRWTGMDKRLDDSVDRVVTLGDDPRVDEARCLLKAGDPKLALAMLEGLAQEKPNSVHVQEAIAEVARALGDDAREQKARQRAARLHEQR